LEKNILVYNKDMRKYVWIALTLVICFAHFLAVGNSKNASADTDIEHTCLGGEKVKVNYRFGDVNVECKNYGGWYNDMKYTDAAWQEIVDNYQYCDTKYPKQDMPKANEKCHDYQEVDAKSEDNVFINCDVYIIEKEIEEGILPHDICNDVSNKPTSKYAKDSTTTTPTNESCIPDYFNKCEDSWQGRTYPDPNAEPKNTGYPHPESENPRPEFDADTGAPKSDGTMLLEDLKSWRDGSELHVEFDPNDLSWFEYNWKEGLIGETISSEVLGTGYTRMIDWEAHGYYINLDYCSAYLEDMSSIKEGYDPNKRYDDHRNDGSVTIETGRYNAGSAAGYYWWLGHVESSDEDSAAPELAEAKACMFGQLYRNFYDTQADTDPLDAQRLSDDFSILDILGLYSDGAYGDGSETVSERCEYIFSADSDDMKKYKSACDKGGENPIERDIYFIGDNVRETGGGDKDDTGGGTGGGTPGDSGTPNPDPPPDGAVDPPAPVPVDPIDVLDPCDAYAIASGSEFYDIEDEVEPIEQTERIPTKQVMWQALISPANNLSREQVAAIMGNIQAISDYNPASVAFETLAIDDTEPPADDANQPEAPEPEPSPRGIGLIHWVGLEGAALLNDIINEDLFSPFFSENSLTPYNGDSAAPVNGDRFFELADSNNVPKEADDLMNLQIRKIINNLDGTEFRIGDNASSIESATNYFYNHLVLTDGQTPAPDEYVEFATKIFEEFQDSDPPVEEDPPEDIVIDDPICFQRNPVGPASDLLDMIKASTKDKTTKAPAYASALISSNIEAQYDGRDAFAFVAAMIRASGFHPNYPVVSAANVSTLDDLQSWKKVISAKELADLKDADLKIGDVLIESTSSKHTLIYIGDQAFSDKKPFAMANTGNSFPYYADRTIDPANIYNVWRRQTLPREQVERPLDE
jgi:hypothetical protein